MKHLTRWNRTGNAMIEMALMLPLFITLTAGIVEFSRVLSVKQVITNAAREGARAGAVDLDDNVALTKARQVSENYLQSCGIKMEATSIASSFVTTGGSAALQVTVNYNYDSLLTTWIPTIPTSFSLQSAAIMRRES